MKKPDWEGVSSFPVLARKQRQSQVSKTGDLGHPGRGYFSVTLLPKMKPISAMPRA